MGLVDDQVLDAGLLEAQAGVLGAVQQPLELLLDPRDLLLQALDGQAALALGLLQHRPQRCQLGALVLLLGLAADRKSLERRAGEDHRVPVVRGGPGDERAALVARQVLAGGRQDASLRVELQPLARELLEHVVGDHHARLGHQAGVPTRTSESNRAKSNGFCLSPSVGRHFCSLITRAAVTRKARVAPGLAQRQARGGRHRGLPLRQRRGGASAAHCSGRKRCWNWRRGKRETALPLMTGSRADYDSPPRETWEDLCVRT